MDANACPKFPVLDELLPTGVPVLLAGKGGSVSTKLEPKLDDGLKGLTVLPANPVGCGCNGVEADVPKADEPCCPKPEEEEELAPVAVEDIPLPNADIPLPNDDVCLFVSLLDENVNAEARSDIAVPAELWLVPDTVLCCAGWKGED